MTSRIQTNRFTTTGSRPPSTRPVGELAINFADNQISVTDPTPTARDILPVRFHSATAAYLTNDIVRQGTGLYQAKANIPAHAFSAIEWNQFLTNTQGDARWLPLAGGTMTGLLTLSGSPQVNLHAATKLYVDTADLTKVPLAGGTMTGLLTLSGAPTSNLHAATKLYVDGKVGLYLPLTGGTLTGNLTIPDSLSFSLGGMALATSAGFSVWTFDSSNYELVYTRANGLLQYRRGDGVELWSVDANGNSSVANGLTVHGLASIGGSGITYTGVPSNGHQHAFGWTGSQIVAFVDATNLGALAMASNLTSYLSISGGTITGNLGVAGAGGLNVSPGGISTTNGVRIDAGNLVVSAGSVSTAGTISSTGNIGSAAAIAAGTDLYARGGNVFFGAADNSSLHADAGGTTLKFSADNWRLFWTAANGSLIFYSNLSAALFTVDGAGNGNFLGTVHGSNVTLMEARIDELQARIAALEGSTPP